MSVSEAPAWLRKTRELHSHFDSTIWNDLHFRDDDIVIGTHDEALNDTPGRIGPPIEPPGDEYEARARRELGEACAAWLATGEGASR